MIKKDIERLRFYQAISEEPWITIPSGKDLANWGHEEEVSFNQSKRFLKVADLYMDAFDFINTNAIDGDYFEFGCHRVRTFRLALTEARRQNLVDMRFHAFDSFSGFPDDASDSKIDGWRAGALATSEEAFWELVQGHDLFVDRIRVIKGAYAKSLTNDLSAELLQNDCKAAMITIHCDLYESALDVFNFIGPFLQEGTVIYIRGVFSGYKGSPRRTVARAFEESREHLGYEFADFNNLGWLGRSFITYK